MCLFIAKGQALLRGKWGGGRIGVWPSSATATWIIRAQPIFQAALRVHVAAPGTGALRGQDTEPQPGRAARSFRFRVDIVGLEWLKFWW